MTWFRDIFGFQESDCSYEDLQAKLDYNSETGELKIGSKQFKAGTFECPSLRDLRTRLDEKLAEQNDRLVVSQVVGDVTVMHGDPLNFGAIFQAASQFNTLEHATPDGTPELGITCYCRDRTQGPACATSCAPGTLIRNYYGLDGKGQRKDRQIENLRYVNDYLKNNDGRFFQVRNGYTFSKSVPAMEELAKSLQDRKNAEPVEEKLCVGVQWDTQVVASGFGSRPRSAGEPEQLVTQVYCSAVAVGYDRRCPAKIWEPFARCVLRSLYEATMYIALQNYLNHPDQPGAKRVFLTAVGGGVFCNDMEWIKLAMKDAFEKFKHAPLEVILVSYGGPTREFTELESECRA